MNETAQEIVRRSGSNLAFALAILPKEKRDDMRVFYAFCRVIDDIADDPDFPEEDRQRALDRWRRLAEGGDVEPQPGLETEFVALREKYSLSAESIHNIIEGVEMDLEPRVIETREELRKYCFHVASAVGLVSIEIFGYTNPRTRQYAEQLGYALQWTNILRDVGEDAEEGRVFLPEESLSKFGISRQEILSGSPDPEAFVALMEREASQAEEFFRLALSALPEEDRKSMRSAELMRRIYSSILAKMRKDKFRVFQKHYRLSRFRMLAEFFRAKIFG